MLALAPGRASALGLGKPSTHAVLGETLRMSVPVRLEPGEQVANDCVAAEVYFGDDKVAGTLVSAQVLPVSGSAAEGARSNVRTLVVRTKALVNEPVVTVLLSAGCQARITRKFIALADPPTGKAALASNDPPGLAQTATDAAEVDPSPLQGLSDLAVAGPADSARAGKGAGARSRETARRPSSNASAPKRVRQQAAAVPVVPPVSRLQVDPVTADALVSPDLRPSADMNAAQAASAEGEGAEVQARRAAAAALWRALNTTTEQQLREQQRLQALEKQLAQLNAEGAQTRQSVSALQGRMNELEAGRSSLGAYAMGVLALAAMGVALFFYSQLRRQERRNAEWWPHSGAAPLSVPREGEPDTASPPDVQDTTTAYVHAPPLTSSPRSADAVQTSAPARTGAGAPQQPSTPVLASLASLADWGVAPPSFAPPHEQEAIEHLRAVSVEELIDLEQQAEFFVVLGQDDAAIGLLEAHVQGTDGTIPLPFLKLLELYQRLGRRADYERVQAAFNAHFNAHAPTWESDLQQGRHLEDYPGVIERLQALWSAPSRAMDVLEKSLIRPDSDAETFDLPAYRELLFLYAIARDLADKPEADLEEPTTSATPLTATRPFIADPDARPTLDVDLCLDELDAPPVQRTTARVALVSEGLPLITGVTEDAPLGHGSDYRP